MPRRPNNTQTTSVFVSCWAKLWLVLKETTTTSASKGGDRARRTLSG